MDGSMGLHFDDDMSNPEDNLARRMKNRERQRRYRARKRNEADMRKALVVAQPAPLNYQPMPTESQPTVMQVEIPMIVHDSVNAPSPDYPTRVHCQRDWKKDARSAHMMQVVRFSGPNNSETTIPGGNQSQGSNGAALENNRAQGVKFGRRHWKAEARNRKASD